MILCGVCRRCIEDHEAAVNFGADARGRLYLVGICVGCYHAPEHAGETLFDTEIAAPDPDAPAPVAPEDKAKGY